MQAQAHILEDWADESLYFYDVSMRCWENNITLLEDDLLIENPGWFGRLIRPLVGLALRKQTASQGIGRKAKEDLIRDLRANLSAVNTLLTNKQWLVGEELSIADISVASMCTVMARAEEGLAIIKALPDLSAWLARVDELTIPPGTAANMVALT